MASWNATQTNNLTQDQAVVLAYNVVGARAELGIRAWFGLPGLEPDEDDARYSAGLPDIGQVVDVKGATGRGGNVNLLVRPVLKDGTDKLDRDGRPTGLKLPIWRYCLGWADGAAVTFVGWTWGPDVKARGKWTQPQHGRPCWLVDWMILFSPWGMYPADCR
jgi:hypothetical protein